MTDWRKGDLALCVKLNPWRGSNTGMVLRGPKPGSIYAVDSVQAGPSGILTLAFAEGAFYRLKDGYPIVRWRASAFRKVTPPKADEFDREVIDLMAGKKVGA